MAISNDDRAQIFASGAQNAVGGEEQIILRLEIFQRAGEAVEDAYAQIGQKAAASSSCQW